MIDVSIDEGNGQRLQAFLNGLGPRLAVEIYQSLKTLLYTGVQTGVQKYFAGSGPKGGTTTGLLTSRSGALVGSLLAAVQTGMEPASPSAGMTEITAFIGSALPYARIQEYGGMAGRPGPFKKKTGHRPYLPPRPYLTPMTEDLRLSISDALPQVVDAASKQQ